ncbi:MAG: hypothetical protein H0W73_14250 [Bacteroidetes bacterium]|nr:hypothetical protein [Bacteroidota bacterium]
MKKVIIGVVVLAFASCNVPKEGEEENIPTSKLEVLTNLGEDSTNIIKDTVHSKH